MEGLTSPTRSSAEALTNEALRLLGEGQSGEQIRNSLLEILRADGYTEDEITQKLDLVEQRINEQPERLHPHLVTPGTTPGPSEPRGITPATPTAALSNEITALQQRLAELTQAYASLANANPPSPATSVERPRKVKVPDPEPFTGKRREWRRFRLQMEFKLENDKLEDKQQVGYVFSRLKDAAANVSISWLNRNEHGSVEEFWRFLEEQFADPMLQEKAMNSLHAWTQGDRSLPLANADFMRLAHDAGQFENNGMLKSIYLRGLKKALREGMISVEVEPSWSIRRLMERVGVVDENIYRYKLNSSVKDNSSKPPGNRQGSKTTDEDKMDWEPSVQHRAGRMGNSNQGDRNFPQAKWANQGEYEKRKAEGRCIRCGLPNHFISTCRFRPPPPASARPSQVEKEEKSEDSEN